MRQAELAEAVARFEAALKAHDIEYPRRVALWRRGQADIMDLMCREINDEISRSRNALCEFEPSDGGRIGNDTLLARAKARLADK